MKLKEGKGEKIGIIFFFNIMRTGLFFLQIKEKLSAEINYLGFFFQSCLVK